MSRSQRMDQLAEVKQGFEDRAGASLARARSDHNANLQQLQKLKEYREEYRRKLDSQLSSMSSAKNIHEYYRFLSMLEDAIQQQSHHLTTSEQQVAAAKNNWTDKHQSTEKLKLAAGQIREQELRASAKLEQSEADEATLQRHHSQTLASKP